MVRCSGVGHVGWLPQLGRGAGAGEARRRGRGP